MKVSAILGLLLASSLSSLAVDEPAFQNVRIDDLNACLAESNKRVAVLRDALQAAKDQRARLALLEDALEKELQAKATLLQQKLDAEKRANDVQELQDELALFTTKHTALTNALAQASKRAADAEQAQSVAMQSLTTAIEDLNASSKSRDALTAQVSTLQERLKAVTGDLQNSESSVTDRDTKLAKALGDLKKAQEAFRKVEAEKLEHEAGLLERSTALQKERDALGEELQRSRAELQDKEESWQQTHVQILEQKSQLEQQITTATQTSLQMQRQLLRIDPIRYELNSADIDREQARARDQVKTILTIFPNATFEISGHTCALGSAESNKTLSEQRAKYLLDFLVAEGVSAEQLSAAGYGEERPVADNDTDAGRRRNRRVEIKVRSADGATLLDTEDTDTPFDARSRP